MGAFDDIPVAGGSGAFDDIPIEKKKKEPEPQSVASRLLEEAYAPAEVAASLATGAVAPAIGGWAGIAGSVLPGPEGQGAAWSQKVTDALTYQPKGKTAQAVTHAVSVPFEKFAEGANWAGEKTTDITGSPLAGTAVTTGIQSLPLIFGTKTVSSRLLPKGEFPWTAGERAAERTANLQADTAATAARDAGFKLPPTQVSQTMFNKTVEGAGGKIKVAQELSIENQKLAQAKFREDLNLAPDTPLLPDTYDRVRSQAGTKYDAVRNTGASPVSAQYVADLATMDAPIRKNLSAYPKDAPPPILAKIDALMEPTLNADAAVSKVKELRAEARKAGSGPTPDKHYASQLQYLADTVEGELERHLVRTGQPASMLDNFRDARKTIAKAYTAERYTTPAGEIKVREMGFGKEAQKGILEGGMKEVADLGGNFEKAAQRPSKIGGVPTSPLDYAMAIGPLMTAVLSGQPLIALGAAAPFLRPPLRSIIKSEGYQNRFARPPDYGPSMASRLVEATQNPYVAGAAIDTATEARERKRRLAEMLKGR